ncbi:class E sortase [Georgenia sp. SUBG003]|uniref:class E sortase n=1 Tax=Georgenia sp. SUBG003 TaxID=1497974 RepID=UPI000A43B49D
MSTDTLDAPAGTPAGRSERRRAARRRRPTVGARIAGVVGELLLTAGVLVGLFVVWQVFWTDVAVRDDQASAVSEIQERFDQPVVEQEAELRTDDPPALEPVAEGEGFATLRVPRWGADYQVPVLSGVGMWDVLNTGAIGHYPETAMPGAVGNFATAAHRMSYGAAYRHVDKLENGDRIVVETGEAWLVYEVFDDYVVHKTETDVIAPVPRQPEAQPTDRLLTLTTCHPLWGTEDRWITHAELVGWVPRSEGMPADLLEVS